MRRNPDAVARAGFVYPHAGAPPDGPDGHHNLAWEVSGDHRYHATHGNLDALVAEIADQPRHVVISSEDFICALHHTDRFAAFIERLRGSGFSPRLVVYLREQADYCESLYVELLKFGLTESFETFAWTIASQGSYRWRDWIFPFAYDDLVRRMQALPNVEVVVRSFDAPAGGSLMADWLVVLGGHGAWQDVEAPPRLNGRIDTATATEWFHRNQLGRALEGSEQHLLARRSAVAASAQPAMSRSLRALFSERFRTSNEAVIARHPQVRAGLSERPQTRVDDGRSRMDVLFSAEMHDALTIMASLARERDALAAKCADLEASQEALLASRRWRITQPIEYVEALFRRPV